MISDFVDFHQVLKLIVHKDLSTAQIKSWIGNQSLATAGRFIRNQLNNTGRKARL